MSYLLKENEELFRKINSFHIEGPGAKELIEQDYLTNTYFHTQKAKDFRHRFINKNKEVTSQAGRKHNDRGLLARPIILM